MEKKRICIVGLGYVGMTLAMHAVRNGYEVHGIETLNTTFEVIAGGKTHFHEPGLDELLKLSLGLNFFVYKKIPSEIIFHAFVITVGTPLMTDQKTPNMGVLSKAIESISPLISENSLVILRSTIPVGTTRAIADQLRKANDLKSINVCFCPERTAEGKALVELQSLPQIVSGNCSEATYRAKEFFELLSDEIVEAGSLEEAELIKLFNNTYRDASFAIANTFNQIAQSFNVDGAAVIGKANYNYDRSSIPKPGFVAGPCLEKDAYILASNMRDGDLKDVLLSIRKANEKLESRVIDFLKTILAKNSACKMLVTGIAFKGVPQTNDMRGSSAVNILIKLAKYADNLTVHDFMNSKEELEAKVDLNSIDPDSIFNESLGAYDYVVILNNHSRYNSLRMHDFIKGQERRGAKIIDAWNATNFPQILTLTNMFIDEKLE